jgi:photosystem II stability/assembly factor-like uncharacterized protein
MKRYTWSILATLLLSIVLLTAGFGSQAAALPGPNHAQSPAGSKGSWQRVWRSEATINDFQALDENTLIGVGTDGMILISVDGGTYWHYEAPVDGIDLHALSASANTLWAAGDNGLVLKSQDVGKTWERIDTGSTVNIHDIFSAGSGWSWLAGAQGRIMRTQDGGSTWQTATTNITTDLNAIKMFADGEHGVAAGDNGVILLTADGGQTWQSKTGVALPTGNLKDLHIAGDKVWLAGSDGRVYFSQDQGSTWQVRANLGFVISRIEMSPGQDVVGWAVGPNGRIAKTSNGGQSWRSNRGDEGYHLYAMALADTDHIWVGGSVMTESRGNWGKPPDKPSWFVWRSQDGGSRWKALIVGLYPWFYNITAITEQDAYAVGQDLQILKTRDGGYSWREIHTEITGNSNIIPEGTDIRGKIFHAIDCAPGNPNDCRAVGREEMLLHTTDGGETWTRETVPGWGKSLYDIVMTSEQSGISVSRNYNYYIEDGIHWKGSYDNGASRTHMDLDMINSWQGVVSTKKPLFDYTTDAGRHWKGYYIQRWQNDNSYHLFYNSGADALDANGDGELDYAWLAGCTVQSSVDGPCLQALILFNPDAVNDRDGWRPLLLDENVPRLQKIEMVNEEAGWVVGYDGEILFTEDRGTTWTKQDSKTENHLYGLDVFSRNLAYAAGWGGDIVRYSEPDRRLNANAQGLNQIDGNLDEWSTLNARHINSDDVDTLVGATPTPQDLDANIRLRWDDSGLYLGIVVTDATLTTSGDVVDKLGIALDGQQDGSGGEDDHVLLFGADGTAQMDGAPMPAASYAISSTNTSYTIEAFIPGQALGDALQHLRKMGVNIALYDAAPGSSAYTSQLFWAGASLSDTPENFGTLTFFQFDRNQPTQKGLATGQLTIDGDLSEWSDEESTTLNNGSADSVQGDFPANDADLSASFRMRWWQDHLFVGVVVQDEHLSPGDGVTLAFDVPGDGQRTAEDLTLSISPDGTLHTTSAAGASILSAGQQTATGYQLELAIPAAALGGNFTAKQKLHFNYGLIDVDGGSSFETAMSWQGASTSGIQADYGLLELVPISKLIKVARHDPRINDTFINEWDADRSYYNLEIMHIRTAGVESPLVRFDISEAVPANAEVSLSYLGLYTVADSYPMTAKIYRLLRPWVEQQTTWQQAANGASWQTAGAKGPQDQAQTATDEQTLAKSSTDGSCGDRNATWFDITTDINDFANGRAQNYGWVLRGDAGAQISYSLASSQHRNPDCLPEIYFEYTLPPGALPTPTPVVVRLYLPVITR